MKYRTLTFLTFVVLQGLGQAQWTQLADWPGNGFDGGYSFVISDQVYVGFGQQLQRFDPTTNSWTARATFPGPGADRKWANAFVINGLAYVGMGIIGNSTFQSDLWAYDPVANAWSPRAALPASPRGGSATFTLNGKGYVCGGTSTGPTFSEVFEYDPLVDEWMQVSDLPTGPRGFPTGFTLNEKGYVYGGYQSGFTNETSEVHRFDPISATWEQVADLPGPGRQSAVSAVVNGVPVLAMGHTAFTQGNNDLYAYDLSTDTWSLINSFPGGDRVYPVAASANGAFFLGTGSNFSFVPQDDWWSFALPTSVLGHDTPRPLVIAPNPVADRLSVHMPEQHRAPGHAILSIMDAVGTLVTWKRVAMDRELAEIDVSGLSSGFYIVRLSTSYEHFQSAMVLE